MKINKEMMKKVKANNSIYTAKNNAIVFYDSYVKAEDQPAVDAAIRKVSKGNVKEYVAYGVFAKKGQVHKSMYDVFAESYKGTASTIIYVRAHAIESDWTREHVPPKSERTTTYLHSMSELCYVPEKFGNYGKESYDIHRMCSNCSREVEVYEIDPSIECVQALNVTEEFFSHKEIEYSVLEKEYAELAGVSYAIARETLKWAKGVIMHNDAWASPEAYESYDFWVEDEEVIDFLVSEGLVLEDTHICPECGHLVNYKDTKPMYADADTGYLCLGHIEQQCPHCFVDLDKTELNPKYKG